MKTLLHGCTSTCTSVPPDRRMPVEMHSRTLRRASPGLSGPAALLITFSTSSSIACKTSWCPQQGHQKHLHYFWFLSVGNDCSHFALWFGCQLTFLALLWFLALIAESLASSGVTTNIRGKDFQKERFSYLPSRTSSSRWRPADTDPSAPEWWSHRTAARWHVPSEKNGMLVGNSEGRLGYF